MKHTTDNNSKDNSTDQQRVDIEHWRIDDGARNGQILPNNCFYLRNDKDEMIASIYRKKDAEFILSLAKEVIQLREENEHLKKVQKHRTEQMAHTFQVGNDAAADLLLQQKANEKLSSDNRVLREALEYYQKGIDHFYKCINFKKSFLDAEAITFMNDSNLKISAALNNTTKD